MLVQARLKFILYPPIKATRYESAGRKVVNLSSRGRLRRLDECRSGSLAAAVTSEIYPPNANPLQKSF